MGISFKNIGIGFANPLWLLVSIPAMGFLMLWFMRSRRRTSKKDRYVLALRCAIVLLIILSLAGTSIRRYTHAATVFFVADLSSSAAGAKAQMESFIASALENKPPHWQAGIITFGKDAVVEHPAGQDVYFDGFETLPNPHFTDIEGALQMAAALLPADNRKRIVLMTDAAENLGDALKSSRTLALQGIVIDGVYYNTAPSAEVQITSLDVPGRLYKGEAYNIRVRIDSTVNTHGVLKLYADRQLIGQERVEIRKGENTFVFKDTAQESGIKAYEVVLQAVEDTVYQNNSAAAFVEVYGLPVVAVVEGKEGEGHELVKMLNQAGLETKVFTPQVLPAALEELRKYHALVLCNVAAYDLGDDKMKALDSYVKYLGRGMLVTGGDNSYALGGYMATPLESLLPVDVDLMRKADIPSLGLVLVIDKSGSMATGQYGISKIELAKEAAIGSTEALRPMDYIGVVAFDDVASWIVKTQAVENVDRIKSDIGTIRPGGGTNMYPALNLAYESLKDLEAQLKHVIVLTDGQSQGGNFQQLVRKMRDHGITVSTVAVGEDSDTQLLQQLASLGGGRYYYTDEFTNIPTIFAKETYLATQSYIHNRTFYPMVIEYSSIIEGFAQGFPPLHGYIATLPKAGANIVLSSDRQDPILAKWQYGLGRVVAWTSDLRGSWTGDWLVWDEVQSFWLNVISWILPMEDEQHGLLDVSLDGDKGHITLDISQNWDEALNVHAVVIKPGGGQQVVSLQATQPGKYEGEFEIDEAGVYLVKVEVKDGRSTVLQIENGLTVSYSPEYDIRNRGSDELLKKVVKETGGMLLDEPAQVFREDLQPIRAESEVWPYLLSAALVLFVIEVALRRLKIEVFLRKWASSIRMEGERRWSKSAFEGKSKAYGEACQGIAGGDAISESIGSKGDVVLQRSAEDGSEVADKSGQNITFSSRLLDARQKRRKRL
ncbi:MAG: VWA domain-containing protein [Clostridia bacterium]|nr:hypothetical protein [Clostridia bacterium]